MINSQFEKLNKSRAQFFFYLEVIILVKYVMVITIIIMCIENKICTSYQNIIYCVDNKQQKHHWFIKKVNYYVDIILGKRRVRGMREGDWVRVIEGERDIILI